MTFAVTIAARPHWDPPVECERFIMDDLGWLQ
jgi:hypothetical protein